MAIGERAAKEVAAYFCKKYGCAEAKRIISARLSADKNPNKTDFWRQVMSQLTYLETSPICCGSEESIFLGDVQNKQPFAF
ncbi:hypothetical protein [Terasakiella pusilla]|jgi:hypothetical protein|uniref:hypothetical protein n=1 Tax=Terasakiella pusilla TaxID=64973 RepID=UPI00048DB73F|nr:hypothetical protein [Terasakiella pusilla]